MTGYEIVGTAWLWLTAALGHALVLVAAYAQARRFLNLAERGRKAMELDRAEFPEFRQ